IQRFPNRPIVWGMAATAYREAGLIDLAEELLSKAIGLDPKNVELQVEYAVTAERNGAWTAAISRWNRALDLSPDNLNIQNCRGNAIWQETIARLDSGSAHEIAADTTSEVSEPLDDGEAAELRKLALAFEG